MTIERASARDDRRIVLVAAMRNEGPYILEWLAYHQAIGFTDFVIASNDCVDASPQLLDRLEALGYITHLKCSAPPGGSPQLAAYAQAEQLPAVRDADWAMALDADEFLNIHVGGGTVPELINSVPEATAFLINWRRFGSAGAYSWRKGFVIERFTRAAASDDFANRGFKTLFTKLDAYRCALMPHRPRFPDSGRITELRYVNGAGEELPRYFVDESEPKYLRLEPEQMSWALAQVNHYGVKSREEYLAKAYRGGGVTPERDRNHYWAAFDRNEEADRSILRHLPKMHRAYEELCKDRSLRAWHRRCCQMFKHHLASLKTTTNGRAVSGGRSCS